jgi:hypothetical protein
MGNHILLETIYLTQTAGSITFDNLPTTGYTDLKIVMTGRDSGGDYVRIAYDINGTNTGNTNLSLVSSGANATNSVLSGQYFGYINTRSSGTANAFGSAEIYFSNYLSTTNKVIYVQSGENNNGVDNLVGFHANIFTSSSAITSIRLYTQTPTVFAAGSKFSLYGISADGISSSTYAPKAIGGNIVAADSTYWYHAWTSTGSFIPTKNITADIMTIGGGGAGGSNLAGGGGAGGVVVSASTSLVAGTTYTAAVGAGGILNPGGGHGGNGSNSSFTGGALSLTASVGGGGGASINSASGVGATGGSGGGGYGNSGGSATSGQGNAGGSSPGGANSAGGGGGAGSAGSNGSGYTGGAGGAGANTYTGWSTFAAFVSATGLGVSGYFAGGGGGGGDTTLGNGGSGGGGAGATVGNAGTVNTGSGGGGSRQVGSTGRPGGAGGSGLVVLRYTIA